MGDRFGFWKRCPVHGERSYLLRMECLVWESDGWELVSALWLLCTLFGLSVWLVTQCLGLLSDDEELICVDVMSWARGSLCTWKLALGFLWKVGKSSVYRVRGAHVIQVSFALLLSSGANGHPLLRALENCCWGDRPY